MRSKSAAIFLALIFTLAGAQMASSISSASNSVSVPSAESFLISGKLAEGEKELNAYFNSGAKNDNARLGLGMLQFLASIQRLSQDLYKYGFHRETFFFAPIVRDLPIKENPKSELLTYESARQIVQTFYDGLAKAEATLAPITDENVKLPVHFGMIKLDLDGDGKVGKDDTFWNLYARMTRNHQINEETAKEFYIKFDRGDVHWLRGYCHLIMGVCQAYLAHDSRETFENTGHLFFARIKTPCTFLASKKSRGRDFDVENISDYAEYIHSIRWEVTEPARMADSLHHFEKMMLQNKLMWKYILAETDDDHEWIPNPNQTGVIPNVTVSEEMVASFTSLMQKIDQILAGKLLIPFWRGNENRGVNLRKVFLEPRTFDLVLWVQGPAALPYLENGKTVDRNLWRDLQRDFGGQFPGFAFWFN